MKKELKLIRRFKINNKEVNSVDARTLWEALGSKQDFSTWVKAKVVDNPFFEVNRDYTSLHKTMERAATRAAAAGGNKIEYIFSMDTAKRVAMAERTPRGEKVRTYFLKCEARLRKLEGQNMTLAECLEEVIKAVQRVKDRVEGGALVDINVKKMLNVQKRALSSAPKGLKNKRFLIDYAIKKEFGFSPIDMLDQRYLYKAQEDNFSGLEKYLSQGEYADYEETQEEEEKTQDETQYETDSVFGDLA